MQNIPQLEVEILSYWKKNNTFQRSLEQPSPRGNFIFFEGPPTANGRPGLHHVLARAFKDVICRYKTMQGYRVERKAGWDTHGLPVEIEIEKKIGISGKADIEKYGVAKFNQQCRESVWAYKEEWERLTERMGYWVDMKHPYITYENSYIESVWWILKQAWNRKLLYRGHKVVPYCPRCGTALSSHEVAQGYDAVTEPSIFVKFRVTGAKGAVRSGDYILAWTTTPWTLPGNVALAVGRAIEYIRLEVESSSVDEFSPGDAVILASDSGTQQRVFGNALSYHAPSSGSAPVSASVNFFGRGQVRFGKVATMQGDELEGIPYEPLYRIEGIQAAGKKSHYVALAPFVSTDEGTGVVHTAVMYGVDDYELGKELDLPAVHTVDKQGRFLPSVKEWAGKFVKDKEVESGIINDLRSRRLLLAVVDYEHEYPFCWRCDTPLLYYAKHSWFIKMTALQNELLANAETVNWHPDHIKTGRFGEWLQGVKDWALSRERYWGTPLPIWQCKACGADRCIGSFDELGSEPADAHRPFIDDITLICDCGGEMRRVPEVIDAWFDSGAMPFAQHHYPFEHENLIESGTAFPADYISEAIDQTRGWFYTLLAVSTILNKGASYKNVICLGHINDAEGRKMSKSKGNVVDPWYIADTYGIDALRYHLYTGNQPGEPKNFDEYQVREVLRQVIMTLLNVLNFYKLYESDALGIETAANREEEHVMDRWIRSLLTQTISDMTQHLDAYRITDAGRAAGTFITDLSVWYVRRSRERMKDQRTRAAASRTLRSVLRDVSILIAPLMPFVAEYVWQQLRERESVHLASWPEADASGADRDLLQQMRHVRAVTESAHALRARAGVKVRQPLQKLEISAKLTPELQSIIAAEVNVKEVAVSEKILGIEGVITDDLKTVALHLGVSDELQAEGAFRELVRQINALRKQRGLKPSDTISVIYGTDSEFLLSEVIGARIEQLKSMTIARSWTRGDAAAADGSVMSINGHPIVILIVHGV